MLRSKHAFFERFHLTRVFKIIACPLACWFSLLISPTHAAAPITLTKGDVVAFVGGANMVQAQRAGHLEALMTHHYAKADLIFRDLAWEADTVFAQGTVIERWRKDGLGDRAEQLKRIGTTVILAQFGQTEAMSGKSGLESFTASYQKLIDAFSRRTKRIVLISPTPFEKPGNPLLPDLSKRNTDLELYVAAIKKLAKKNGLVFVDVFHNMPGPLTSNGRHVLKDKQALVATAIAKQLGVAPVAPTKLEPLRIAIVEKHRLWYDYWRPANWKCLYGDDGNRVFGRGGKNYVPFKEEWKQFPGLIKKAETYVWQVAKGEKNKGLPQLKPETLRGSDQTNIKKELASFSTAEDLEVNLFASEVEGLTTPLAIRWDPAGRMYVTCTTVYPQIKPGQVPNDKIVVLEDTNHDGRADKSTVFADGLNIPTGFELGGGGVYVGQGTEILLLKDTNGDGRADERRVVLGGFGNGDSHQTINSFIWSPGGELYFGQGDGAESRVETPWGTTQLFQSGLFRFRPRRLQLDALLDDFMGPANPWGIAFDDWGQAFCVDGAGGISYFTPGMIPTKHRQKLNRIGKPGGYCGVEILSGSHLPKSMQGDFVLGDFKRNTVARFSLRPKGAGFEVVWKKPLLHSKHRNFRPVDVKVGPDGAIYVVDFYNPLICHQDDSYRDPRRDKSHGRIWRLTNKKSKLVNIPKLATAPLATLLDSLKSSERWTRYQAKRALAVRKLPDVVKALRTWVQGLDPKAKQYEHHLFEALGVYETIEVVEPKLLAQVLQAKDHRARAYAARVVGRWHDRLVNPLAMLTPLVEDAHPRVRMEAVIACAAIPSPQSIESVARVVDRPSDPWIDYVFTQAVHQLKPHWMPALAKGEVTFDGNAKHRAAVLGKVRSKNLLASLQKLARSKDLDAKSRAAVLTGIIAVGGGKELRQAFDTKTYTRDSHYDANRHAAMLSELAKVYRLRKARPDGDLVKPLRAMLSHPHAQLRTRALELIGLWKIGDLKDQVVKAANNNSLATPIRRAAFNAIVSLDRGQAKTILTSLATATKPLPIRAAAVEALSRIDIQSAAALAAKLISKSDSKSFDPGPTVVVFLSRKEGTAALATALGSVKLPAATAKLALAALYSTGRFDKELVTLFNKAIGITGQTPPYSERFVKALVSEAAAKGNRARGAAIFRSTTLSCTSCHRVGTSGGQVGPDLSAVGTTLPIERIVEEVLWPKRQVKEGYTLTRIVTTDGIVLQGFEFKSRKRGDDFLLRDPATAKIHRIPRNQIDSRKEVGTSMPSGLTAGLTRSQLLDLLHFLSKLGSNETTK